MSKFTNLLLFVLQFTVARAQDCDNLYVDITKGTLNGLSPKVSQDEVKKVLSCFTATKPDGSAADCGGGVFFAKHYFFFYTGADNINIRKGFTGKCSAELIGVTEKKVTELLGKPEGELNDNEGAKFVFYKTSYGCIVVAIDEKGNVSEFFMYAIPVHEVNLCV